MGVRLVEPGWSQRADLYRRDQLPFEERQEGGSPASDEPELAALDIEKNAVETRGLGAVIIDDSDDLGMLQDTLQQESDAARYTAVDLDMRNCETLGDLLHRLTSLSYASEHILKFSNFRSAPNWRHWSLPSPVSTVTPCLHLELEPNCGNICRRNATAEAEVKKGKWPELTELMGEPGVW